MTQLDRSPLDTSSKHDGEVILGDTDAPHSTWTYLKTKTTFAKALEFTAEGIGKADVLLIQQRLVDAIQLLM